MHNNWPLLPSHPFTPFQNETINTPSRDGRLYTCIKCPFLISRRRYMHPKSSTQDYQTKLLKIYQALGVLDSLGGICAPFWQKEWIPVTIERAQEIPLHYVNKSLTCSPIFRNFSKTRKNCMKGFESPDQS